MLRLSIVCLICGWTSVAWGQQPLPTGGTSPLGIRQQRVERMMEDLERKFKGLKLALQANEPERAERLQQTLNKAKELLIQKRMGDVTRLLDEAQLDTAGDGQKALIADIRALLALLLDEKTDREKIREQYELLSEWRRQVESLIRAERGEKREADRLANKEQTLANLAAKIKGLEGVIRDEKEIVSATQRERGEGIQGLGKIASEQKRVRDQAEAIANRIAKEAGDEKGPFEPQAEGDLPAGSTNASEKEKAARPAEPGEKPLGQAVGNQRKAEASLGQGKGKAAQQEAEAAVANLERALAELKNESQRIASLPPEAFDRLARKQDDIASQTGQLGQQMQQQSQQPAGGQPGSQNAGGKPQPGQEQIAKAQQSMQQASGGLRSQEPADASRQQGRAIKELEQALAEIEERLNQLREETQIEKLARLEGRFRDMLSIQQRLTVQTAALEKKRIDAGGQLARSDRNAVRVIGDEERRMEAVKTETEAKDAGLGGKAQQALDIINDDGTSVVFSDIVEQLRDDLVSTGNLLVENLRTDSYMAAMQREIETTLEELIEALQQAQQQKEASGGGGGGSGSGQEPLLPNSAELKLLRSAQLRINRRTVALDQARPKNAKLDEALKGETRKIADRQLEIAEMTVRILERKP
jgi:hypothetical protein